MDRAPDAGSAQAAEGVARDRAVAKKTAGAVDATPGWLNPGVQVGGPQGPAIDRRYAGFPTRIQYKGYVRTAIPSVEGFQKLDRAPEERRPRPWRRRSTNWRRDSGGIARGCI